MEDTHSKKDETEVMELGKQDDLLTSSVSSTLQSAPRAEMSATAIARLMGVATASELKILEGKLDLILSRVSALSSKVEKLQTTISRLPSGADLERIDVHLGALKKLFGDFLATCGHETPSQK